MIDREYRESNTMLDVDKEMNR